MAYYAGSGGGKSGGSSSVKQTKLDFGEAPF